MIFQFGEEKGSYNHSYEKIKYLAQKYNKFIKKQQIE